jgi:hypothetical protein
MKENVQHIDYVFSHWKEIVYFSVSESDKAFAACRLEVYFSGGRKFSIYFGSLAVAWSVIHQPLFEGLMIYWFGKGYQIRSENNLLHPIIGHNQHAN